MDMEALMAQAAELQNKVSAAQDKLSKSIVKGISYGGACIVDMTGKYDLINLYINPDVLARPVAEVQEIISAAFRDAKTKADDMIDDVMGEATAGVQMPN